MHTSRPSAAIKNRQSSGLTHDRALPCREEPARHQLSVRSISVSKSEIMQPHLFPGVLHVDTPIETVGSDGNEIANGKFVSLTQNKLSVFLTNHKFSIKLFHPRRLRKGTSRGEDHHQVHSKRTTSQIQAAQHPPFCLDLQAGLGPEEV